MAAVDVSRPSVQSAVRDVVIGKDDDQEGWRSDGPLEGRQDLQKAGLAMGNNFQSLDPDVGQCCNIHGSQAEDMKAKLPAVCQPRTALV